MRLSCSVAELAAQRGDAAAQDGAAVSSRRRIAVGAPAARRACAPRKSTSTSSALRRPIFSAEEKGAFGIERHRDRRLADRARAAAPARSSRRSASSSRMITDTVCAESPVIRAISDLAGCRAGGPATAPGARCESRMPALVGAALQAVASAMPAAAPECRFPPSASFPGSAFGRENGDSEALLSIINQSDLIIDRASHLVFVNSMWPALRRNAMTEAP